MNQQDWLAEQFDSHRPTLRAVAYRMLGSLSEADDALQEAWLRASGADTSRVERPVAWLTTVVGRVCLNILRARRSRKEEPLDARLPDPVVSREDDDDPEHRALLADAVGLALLVVFDTLAPAERLAFVLHDMFAVPFDDIGPMIDRTPAAARQLASRARRRVREQAPVPDADRDKQRDVVDAFFAAAREGDLDALVAVLAPDVVLRSDGGVARARHTLDIEGARSVAGQAASFSALARFVRPALINGTAGAVVIAKGRPLAVMAFTVSGGVIATVEVIADPERLVNFDLTGFRD
ncbi:RNA polymerase subunit sigma-70 [Prauserella marina]|uniref:RNA polymerase sigma-70 factor, ECF subfamily n=1 Tax=Prauserella marina TaxID=530584 RepID=A0A222VL37_9PSEU|nr:sigma-70 family RNA polymerase sigma factor [Prauserella marina]ASR34542.1 RNA polymerase subunit sigma-70 [Prauserella marina]PWV85850.1 RNA polymerase sigma-70 factor (ECF subfamily) [Prauserella marina]SDC43972.1 RNA polymerase sigma-70 factor, ECF subfamily [Prauserella marina]